MAQPSSDRRAKARQPVNIRVDYKVGAYIGRAVTVDLSETGVFVNTNRQADPGNEVALKLYFEEGAEPLKALGTVRRIVKPGEGPLVGLGIQFERIYAGSRKALRAFLSDGMGVSIDENALGDFMSDEDSGSRMSRYVFDKHGQIQHAHLRHNHSDATHVASAKEAGEDLEILKKFQFAPTLLKRIGWRPILFIGLGVVFYFLLTGVFDWMERMMTR